ncbi:MAG: alcohol dehydrogenase catalytic domain-containing protein [Mycoplasma sp.]|nr:alcohol dehydrogenase catalytic domain-containing protein [Mycoplasma sp.]
MINYRYRITKPKTVEKTPILENIKNNIIVRPKYLSICAADQRYYFGWRDEKILEKKYPLSLIHEAVGQVVYDSTKEFSKNDFVVLVPNQGASKINSNYIPETKFLSSNLDGYMQEFVVTKASQIIKINPKNNPLITYSLTELTSVAFHAIKSVKNEICKHHKIGIWGDGSLGFILHCCIKFLFPKNEIFVFGKHNEKLNLFNNYAKKINIKDELSRKNKIDIAFECVGGKSSENAIRNIIEENINPLGKIVILGVSENEILINTRKILEKGIKIIGRSRSDLYDFKDAINFLDKAESKDLNRIISLSLPINSIKDIKNSFEESLNQMNKVVMEWNI